MHPELFTLKERLLGNASYIAAQIIQGRIRLAETAYLDLQPEHRPPVAARVAYDLLRLAGKDAARGWLDLVFALAGAPAAGEHTPMQTALESADEADLARIARTRKP